MNVLTDADKLYQAASLVEHYARGTTVGPWSPQHTVDTLGTVKLHAGPEVNGYLDGLVMEWTEETIEEYGGEPSVEDLGWIALMSPRLAVPLIALLRSHALAAEDDDWGRGDTEVVAIANAILGIEDDSPAEGESS